MTRHTIRVKNIFKTNWESDVDFLQLHQIADKFINSSIIIIYDMDNKPLEVHCYYKNEYITPDLMELLKPNILMEDFKHKDYFSKKDMDFLDMLKI